MMYSSILIVILLIGLVWYLATNGNNNVRNKKLAPVLIGVVVVAVLAITVVPMFGGFGMFHGMGYGMGMRCW
ncbi:hypothetical protein [Companilactobacillus sp. HBUAS59699]|uniref:hypothetical protein n=1 Tax=Companilactobacillus sp. HBUAS59699 TaxID=3109358 RepID=UPI002FF24ABD